MTHPFYCQTDYQDNPILETMQPEKRDETCACVCAASMMIENLLDLCFPPEACLRFAKQCGTGKCEDSIFPVFCGSLAGRFGLRVTSFPFDESLAALRENSALRILLPLRRVLGSGSDLLSHPRHIVLLEGAVPEGFLVLDPLFRPGRSNRYVRKYRLRQEDPYTIVPEEVLREEYYGAPVFTFSKR